MALMLFALVSEARAQSTKPPPNALLFLGSSFVKRVKRPLVKLFKADGRKVKIVTRGPAFYTLERHLGSAKTMKLIHDRPWDVVLLAQNSVGINSFSYEHAEALHDIIEAHGSETCLFMTWRDRDASLATWDSLHGEPGGSVGYVPIALQLDVAVAPVGWVIRQTKLDGLDPVDPWGNRRHLNSRGKYLAALAIYATLTRTPFTGLGAPGSFSGNEIGYMQAAAASIVLDDPSRWNIHD